MVEAIFSTLWSLALSGRNQVHERRQKEPHYTESLIDMGVLGLILISGVAKYSTPIFIHTLHSWIQDQRILTIDVS